MEVVQCILNLYDFRPVCFSVKESVEKNLLSDIALAIHSGISVDEIIGDLTEPGTNNNLDSPTLRL